jgi:hypothetical protein
VAQVKIALPVWDAVDAELLRPTTAARSPISGAPAFVAIVISNLLLLPSPFPTAGRQLLAVPGTQPARKSDA